MKPVFFDTWAWTAIVDKDDAAHNVAVAFYRDYLRAGRKPVTTNYILAETITLLRGRIHHAAVIQFTDTIYRRIRTQDVVLEWITPSREQTALTLLRRYADKPQISFIDLTSFAIMFELSISVAFTGDEHFDEVGERICRLFHQVKGQWQVKPDVSRFISS